jgi:N utilization substance protein B
MKRRRAREYALQILFQIEMTDDELSEDLLRDFWVGINEEDEVREFTHAIVTGTAEHMDEIDGLIKKAAKHWHLDRMAVVDRTGRISPPQWQSTRPLRSQRSILQRIHHLS